MGADEKIKKLLEGPILLDFKRRKAILNVLDVMTAKERDKLLGILEDGRRKFKSILTNYIKLKGKSAVDALARVFAKGGMKISNKQEASEKESENAQMDKLLEELN